MFRFLYYIHVKKSSILPMDRFSLTVLPIPFLCISNNEEAHSYVNLNLRYDSLELILTQIHTD